MGNIHILDDLIANQIAAGEVVERPASVVKELVENSIDAGSTRIDISIEEGGLGLIRVKDNGSGMESEDCEMAFYRHATSKIVTSKDLFQIRTLGFRGEALPSIAAVAKVECVTSAVETGLGRKLIIEGGAIRSLEETAAERGTDFLVKALFFNTPARLKYMKTMQTELSNVSDYIYRLALAHPTIAFTLRHHDGLLLQTLGNGDLLQVIAAIYGTTAAKQMMPIQGESLDYAVQGFISKPEWTRANRSGISTVINGRYIRNYALVQSLLHAYHTLLPINRFPLAVLHIKMDPVLLDVNVHPSKLEVRFSKETELLDCVVNTIKDAFRKIDLIPSGNSMFKSVQPAVIQEQMDLQRLGSVHTGNIESQIQATPLDNCQTSYGTQSGTQQGIKNETQPQVDHSISRESTAAYSPPASNIPTPDKSYPKLAFSNQTSNKQWMKMMQPSETGHNSQLPTFPQLQAIGQLHGTYIVAQNETGLFLIDQHAAHERIHYEYYYYKFGEPEEASQQLLIPITLEFTPSDAAHLKTKLHLFEPVGLHIEFFGGNAFIVRAYPHWFPQGEEKSIIEEMAEWILSEKNSIDLAKLREKSAILCSCKASIKANQSLTLLEIESLLDRLSGCHNPYTCPHGRPIVVSFSTYDLEKLFKRVM